jgi:hypothetical protein
VTTAAITLPQAPDYLLIRVAPNSYATYTDADWCLAPQTCSITWDNQAGLLSSTSPQQLWRMSRNNGYALPWSQWSGLANSASSALSAPGATTGGGRLPTVGGELLLAVGQDISCSAGVAGGVGSGFSFSCQLTVLNQSASSVTPIVTVIAINSGFLQSANGRSIRTTTPLTEADVLGANGDATEVMTQAQMQRLVGSGIGSFLANAVAKAKGFYEQTKPAISGVKRLLANSDNPTAKRVADGLSKVGYGVRTGAGSELESRFM